MKTRITCPHCDFTTEISTERIPEKARFASCPRCRNRIPLPAMDPPSAPRAAPAKAETEHRPETGIHKQGQAFPDSGVSESTRGPSPWEDRERVGLWPGIYRSFRDVLLSPAGFFRHLHHHNGLREPLAMGLLFGSLGVMLSLFWDFAMAVWGFGSGINGLASRLNITLLFPLLLVLSPLIVAAALFVMSGVLHILLLTVGGGKNGFEGTFRVFAYGQATQILGAIPFLGGVLAGIWFLVVLIVGLREIHETTYARVILAFLLVTVLGVAVLVASLVPILISLFQ